MASRFSSTPGADACGRASRRRSTTTRPTSHASATPSRGAADADTPYNPVMTRIASSVLQAVGRTPLVQLTRVVAPGSADVLIKLELANPTGSYKDRMALAMIEGAEQRGALRPGMRVVE